MKKKTRKRIYCILSAVLLTALFCLSPLLSVEVRAEELGKVFVENIVNYLLSTLGVVQYDANGNTKINNAGHTERNSIYNLIVQNWGTENGIFEDEDGNYIFSNYFMKKFYETLDGSDYEDVSVHSTNIGFEDYTSGSPLQYRKQVELFKQGYYYNWTSYYNDDGTPRSNVDFSNALSQKLDNYYLISGVSLDHTNGDDIAYRIFLVDLTGVAYIKTNDRGTKTYNTGSFKNYGFQKYNLSSKLISTNVYATEWRYNHNSNSYFYKFTALQQNEDWNISIEDLSKNIYSSLSVVFCNDSKSGAEYVLSASSNNIQYVTRNTNTTTVSKDTINNNNWSNIYNNYVTNVNNSIEDGMSLDDVRKIMSGINATLEDAIEKGTDIENAVDTSNAYLRLIYEKLDKMEIKYDGTDLSSVVTRLDTIISLLQSFEPSYLARIYTILDSIDKKMETLDDNGGTIADWLSDIYGKIPEGSGGGGGSGGGNGSTDLIDDFNIILDPDLTADMIGITDILGPLLENIVPFCYLGIFGAILTALSADPVRPDFNIPFRVESLDIDAEIPMSEWLLYMDEIQPILSKLLNMLFIVLLGFFSFRYIKFVLDFFG